jgi:hypothetical protein
MTRSRIAVLTAATTLLATGGLASNAGAAYHEQRISEIHQGTATNTGDFVELQAFSAGQNFTANHYVATYDGGGGILSQVLLPSFGNGASQATILVAADASVPGADVTDAGLNVVNTGGYVCFTETVLTAGVDCVAYGNVSGAPPISPAGTPAAVAELGLDDNQSLTRSITRGCATALDPADDTNNSVADFALTAGTPRGNTATPTETLCATPKKKKCKKKKGKGKAGASAKKKCKKKKKKK